MRNFKMGRLDDWQELTAGELLSFDLGGQKFRAVTFDIVADRHCNVFAVRGEKAVLVGCGEGMFTTSFTVTVDCLVGVAMEADGVAYMRSQVRSQVVPNSGKPAFTRIEPRTRGPSDEVRRLMHIMNINSEQRERQLRREYQKRLERLEAQAKAVPVIEKLVEDAQADGQD